MKVIAAALALLAALSLSAEAKTLYERQPERTTEGKTYAEQENARRVHTFTVCNDFRGGDVYVAYSYIRGDTWRTAGWRRIARGACSKIFNDSKGRYAYFYAQSADRRTDWNGNTGICVHRTKAFDYAGERCPSGYVRRGFERFDFGMQPMDFTLDLY